MRIFKIGVASRFLPPAYGQLLGDKGFVETIDAIIPFQLTADSASVPPGFYGNLGDRNPFRRHMRD